MLLHTRSLGSLRWTFQFHAIYLIPPSSLLLFLGNCNFFLHLGDGARIKKFTIICAQNDEWRADGGHRINFQSKARWHFQQVFWKWSQEKNTPCWKTSSKIFYRKFLFQENIFLLWGFFFNMEYFLIGHLKPDSISTWTASQRQIKPAQRISKSDLNVSVAFSSSILSWNRVWKLCGCAWLAVWVSMLRFLLRLKAKSIIDRNQCHCVHVSMLLRPIKMRRKSDLMNKTYFIEVIGVL